MTSNILAFVLGVWLLQQQAALPTLVWTLLLPLMWLVSRFLPALPREVLAKVFFLGLGFFWAAFMAQQRLQDALPTAWEGRDIQVVGVVAALPATNERGMRFEFDVERVKTLEAVVPHHIQLSAYSEGFGKKASDAALPDFHAGERWQLTVRLKRPHGNANPNGFDFEAWLLERNIRASGYVRQEDSNRRLAEHVYRPGYMVEMLRERVAQRFQTVLGERPYAGVLKALAVGEQNAISPDQWRVFLRTGVNHLMSISGLHVTMISSLAFALVYGLWRRSQSLTLRLPARKAAAVAGALAALLYALLSGFGVPTQRTLYMLSVVAAALWLGRASSASSVLALAVLVVLLIDPWAVLSPGFWLSFGAVAAILYVGVGRLGRPHWLRAWANVQWAVTLGLVPALLLMFQQVSIVSPLANAFAIPVISLVVVPLTLAGAILPLDSPLLLAHQVMTWCMAALEWLSQMPDAVWQQHAPPLWTVLAAAIGIFWLLLPRGFPARWLGAAGLMPMFMVLPPQPEQGALWLSVLDVGQGLAVVVQTRNHALLYDTGPRYTADADSGSRIVVPYLRAAGIKRLDGLIVTHDDSDHSGGAASVLDAVPVGWLASSLPADSPILPHARKSLPCYAGQSWEWDGVHFEMLHPGWESYADEHLRNNARGCTLKITSPYGSVLLPADIERESEAEILARTPDALAATLLVAPHHGSKTSSTEAFIHQVNPSIVIFTAGYRNHFGHPKPEVVERYRVLGSRLYRSDFDGAVLLRFEKEAGVKLQTWRQERHRYWQER
ncbi:DNA internalization-related competence protein ComEC/Rec2 [Sulfuricella denitrificans skB26]|uniref:DNA internalization-related competence protein ComEC/Rec2 n=1 Tax=Sulfuricella denitrificans (strain DSM 22764 / NBRC 105220 / skB26) TaxID=1163617 RepID=S6AK23_SULDS|nr:DNA internalization-related competence protein ComEC/Rec2 [Sulfuricella denitrificans]BAN34939.1 DNA internalization-related competence protein ComEC/Rec2 [Sulfuricella denitrificans skB26]